MVQCFVRHVPLIGVMSKVLLVGKATLRRTSTATSWQAGAEAEVAVEGAVVYAARASFL